MKFCIANTSYWESKGYNPIHWRKSIDGTKALCHLEYGEILAKKLEDNPNVQIYDNIDPTFQAILRSAEWVNDGIPEIIEDDSLSKRVSDLEDSNNLKIAKIEKNINDYKSTMANVNVNQEAKQKVTGYETISLPKTAANGQVSVSVKGLTATNLVKNGNFSTDLSEWTYYNEKAIWVNGRAYFNSTAESGLISLQQDLRINHGSKIYISLDVEHIKTASSPYGVFNNGGDPHQLFDFADSTLGKQKLSNVFTFTNWRYLYINTLTDSEFYIDNIIVVDLTQTFGVGNEPTKEQCDLIFANYFDGTKSTVSASRLKSKNKNLLNKHKYQHFEYGGTNNIAYPLKDILEVGKTYILSMSPIFTSKISELYPSGIEGTVLPANALTRRTFTWTQTARDGDYKLHIRTDSPNNLSVQLEEGTVATPYEPYKESTQYLPNVGELRSLPKGTKDEIRVSGGKAELVKRVSGEFAVPMSNWYFSSINEQGFIILINYMTLPNFSAQTYGEFIYNKGMIVNNSNLPAYTTTSNSGIKEANAECIATGYATGVNLYIIVHQDNYNKTQDRAGANAWINENMQGVTLNYQLAEPIITPIDVSGTLLSNPSGTIYIEPVTNVAGIYKDKVSVLATELPIQSIDKISKIDFTTGNETLLDVSKVVIASDKLSLTHPNLTSDDIVFFEYYYPQEITTIGNVEVEYLDSRYTLKDSVTSKFYKWETSVVNGIPSINLVEVL